jgi:hypothetical protein
VWQALHADIEPLGATVVTVALDIRGAEAARSWIERAAPTHPSLIDQSHVTDELLGFVNVPMAVWIDEQGTLVQPAHVAQVQLGGSAPDGPLPDTLPERLRETILAVRGISRTADRSVPALRDWVEKGEESAYWLPPDEVIARSRPRPPAHAEAAACFELAQHFWRLEDHERATHWFRRAHELHPENWTYKRQAWTLATTPEDATASDLLQGPTELYEGNWLADIQAMGPENYYEPLRLER